MSDSVKAVHVRLEGFTAFFRVMWTITATQLTLSTPSYSTILGLLSAASGKIVRHTDTRIGFEFTHISESQEMERTDRFELSGKYLKKHSKGQSLIYRQIHFRPQLDLYLTNLDLFEYFKNPIAPLCLGRSQDLCWIKEVEIVDLMPVKSGNLGSTMIGSRFLGKRYISPEFIRCVEWFDNDTVGVTRKVGNVGLFQVTSPDNQNRTNVTMNNLYHPSNLREEDVIYLHEWSKPLIRVSPKKRSKK